LSLAFLALAFCVFTWGLQYKLSLYDPPQAVSHQIPTAKLLSRDEQATASESPLIRENSVSQKVLLVTLFSFLLSFFLLALNLLGPGVQVSRGLNTELPWLLRMRASMSAFFFRPPPFLA
jgi:hypothetical protein